jgi:hypothetical protein
VVPTASLVAENDVVTFTSDLVEATPVQVDPTDNSNHRIIVNRKN